MTTFMYRKAGPPAERPVKWEVNLKVFRTSSNRAHLAYFEVGNGQGRVEIVFPDPWDDKPYSLLVRNMEVDPNHQGQGMAMDIIYSAVWFFGTHYDLRLNVADDNRTARHIYRKMGFKKIV